MRALQRYGLLFNTLTLLMGIRPPLFQSRLFLVDLGKSGKQVFRHHVRQDHKQLKKSVCVHFLDDQLTNMLQSDVLDLTLEEKVNIIYLRTDPNKRDDNVTTPSQRGFRSGFATPRKRRQTDERQKNLNVSPLLVTSSWWY